MNKKLYSIVLFGICATAAMQLSAQVLDVPVATVKLIRLQNISQKELREKVDLLKTQAGRALTKSEIEQLLDNEIATVLLQQAAEKDRISAPIEELNRFIQIQKEQLGVSLSDTDFRRLIEKETGSPYRDYEKAIKDKLVVERYIFSKNPSLSSQSGFTPSEQMMLAYYEENASQFTAPSLIRFTHLYIDTRRFSAAEVQNGRTKINELRRKISTGQKNFETLLKDSLDDPEYGGGDFGYIARGEQQQKDALGQGFIDGVFSLKEGEISSVLESKVGFHIIKITDRRPPRLLQLNDPVFPGERVTVRDQISQLLIYENRQKEYQDALETQVSILKKDAEIRIFSQNLTWN